MPAKNSTTRFSSRVDDYLKTRPQYPIEIIDLLAANCGLTPESVIADIGTGTGFLARIFLENGNSVIGVEPNKEMREGGERYLAEFARYKSLEGSAEATHLPARSMDFIVVGQAFHWFDHTLARDEFKRTLKEDGWVVLVWNDRRVDSTPFLRDYEALLQEFGRDYNEIEHKNVPSKNLFTAFFGAIPLEATFENRQSFDVEGLASRLNSASYMPGRDDPAHAPMLRRAREIFDAHQRGGKVSFEYDTRVFYAPIS